jgi:ribosomal protein S6
MEKNETQQESKSKIYELGYLLVPTIAEENVAAEVQTIKSVLEKHDAIFITEDFPKLNTLAYTMAKTVGSQKDKYDKGYFGWVKFETSAPQIPFIKAELDKNEHILRFMTINTVRENTLISPKMNFKSQLDGEKDKKPEEGIPVSEAELDKTIENLVVE